MHVGMGVDLPGPGRGPHRPQRLPQRAARSAISPSRSASSRCGASSTTSPTTRCAPTCCSTSPTSRGAPKRIQLGSMVVVLPWHDPLRVAEQVVVLDHMSNGRFILGIGRGLGRVEFEGFGVNQEDSRAIFVESAQMLLDGLERGYVEYDGQVREAGAARAAAAAVQVVPRPHLRRGRLARVVARSWRSSASAS